MHLGQVRRGDVDRHLGWVAKQANLVLQQRLLGSFVLVAVLSAEHGVTRRQAGDEVVDDGVVSQQRRHRHLDVRAAWRFERHALLRLGGVGQRLHEVGVGCASRDEDVADAVVHVLEQLILWHGAAHLVPLRLGQIEAFANQRPFLYNGTHTKSGTTTTQNTAYYLTGDRRTHLFAERAARLAAALSTSAHDDLLGRTQD